MIGQNNRQVAEPISILCAGDFGAAVSGRLLQLRRDATAIRVIGGSPVSLPVSRANIVASSRPRPELFADVSAASAERSVPFLPLFTDGASLQLGPVILPGRGACWDCWLARQRQHDSWARRHSHLSEYYRQHPGAEPAGYLECFVTIAAARLSQAIDAIDAGDDLGGSIWELDMMTREVSTSKVVGVHDCSRCGLRRPVEARSVSEILERLAYLWS